MGYTPAIPPRPPISTPCSCIWRALEERRKREASEHAKEHEAAEHSTFQQVKSTLNPLNAIPSGLFGQNKDGQNMSPEELPPISPTERHAERSSAASASTVGNGTETRLLVDPRLGVVQKEKPEDFVAIARRAEKKADILKKKGWVGKGKPNSLFSRTNENKIADLISFREDLVHILESLIPLRHLHNPHSTHPPLITPVPNSTLCSTCQQYLAYAMYFAPPARSAYLRESATVAYLSLMDDAIASLEGGLPLEYLTHHELDSIIRRELAVVEWRVSLKLSKFHKKTGFLEEFPVRLGEYAEFEVNVKPPGPPEGIVKRTGKKILSAVGLSSAPPSSEVQGSKNEDE